MFVNGNSFMFGTYFLAENLHITTLMLWMTIRGLETHDAHCGYEFPWSPFRLIPFGGDASYHDFHHTRNVGNYGTFMTIWDTLFDTNKDYYAKLAKDQDKLNQIKLIHER